MDECPEEVPMCTPGIKVVPGSYKKVKIETPLLKEEVTVKTGPLENKVTVAEAVDKVTIPAKNN